MSLFNWKSKNHQNLNIVKDSEANKQLLICVKDIQLGTFGPILEVHSIEQFKKSFIVMTRDVKQKDNPLVTQSQYFELYEIGYVNKDDCKGLIYDTPKLHFNLGEAKK